MKSHSKGRNASSLGFDKFSKPICFKHFNRKGWAIMASLHREVIIGVLTGATLFTAAQSLGAAVLQKAPFETTAFSQEESDTIVTIAEATVTASRAPLPSGRTARLATIITAAELNAAGIVSVNDALKLASTVDVRQRGAFGIQTDISIDGGTFDQVSIFLNGVPWNNPQTGHNAADFPVSISDIIRIEVVEGASSRLFGSQAFSGAVNIVTQDDNKPERIFSGEVSVGSYATLLAHGRVAKRFVGDSNQWNAFTSFSAGGQRSDGAVMNGDFKGIKGFWQLTAKNDNVSMHAQAGLTMNDFGALTFYSPAYPNQWEATRRYLFSLRAETEGKIHLQPTITWNRSTDHFQLVRSSHFAENFNRTDVFTFGINSWFSSSLGRTALGVEFRNESLLSGNLGHPMDSSFWVKIPGQDSLYYNRKDERTNLSAYVEHNVILRHWTLSAGFLLERNSDISNQVRAYPGVDISWRPFDGFSCYASWNKALRQPTFTDLWYKSPTQQGNVGLRPEKCEEVRLGAEWSTSWINVALKSFYKHGTDMIDWVMYNPKDVFHSANFKLNSMGASIRFNMDMKRILGSRQPIENLSANYSYVHQQRRDNAEIFKSNYSMEYLRHKFVCSLRHRIVRNVHATWNLRLQQRMGGWQVYSKGTPTDEIRPYGTHSILDCRLEWDKEAFNVYADLTNLTSTRYYDYGNVPQPRFLFMCGVRLKVR